MTAAEHRSDFELTKYPVSRASYVVFVVRSGENYTVIIPSHCIWIFLKHNSPRPNDVSVRYITIGWDGFLLTCSAPGHYLNQLYPWHIANLTHGTNGWSSNLKTTIFNKENFNKYENVVSEMSPLWARPHCSAWLVEMIWRHCQYYALCCCVFKIVLLYVKRRFVLYCSRARMTLRNPFVIIQLKPFIMMFLNVSGWKPLEKNREILNFSMTLSSDASFCLEGYFHKRCIPAPEDILLYRKHALDLCS